jgi:phosphatidate cytidylyltransferase
VKELLLRAATGAVYVALTLWAAWSGPKATLLLFLPVAAVAGNELRRLMAPTLSKSTVIAVSLVAYIGMALPSVHPDLPWQAGALAALLALVAATVPSLRRGPASVAQDLPFLATLITLVMVPFALLPHLAGRGAEVFAGMMFLLWTNDTGAYLVGRSMGRTRLLPSISPNKTVEGLAGGALLAMAIGYLLAQVWTVLDTPWWVLAGALIAVTATVGDLLESGLKRARGVKDSGHVLPGHGGVLDRFDGLLLASPAYAFLISLSA